LNELIRILNVQYSGDHFGDGLHSPFAPVTPAQIGGNRPMDHPGPVLLPQWRRKTRRRLSVHNDRDNPTTRAERLESLNLAPDKTRSRRRAWRAHYDERARISQLRLKKLPNATTGARVDGIEEDGTQPDRRRCTCRQFGNFRPRNPMVCFTLNRQSIYGAAAAARSATQQRQTDAGPSTLKVWPVPMRIERSEKDRLDIAHTIGRTAFSGLMLQLTPVEIDAYWSLIGVNYEPYYAYEEVLAVFKDLPGQTNSILARLQAVAGCLAGTALSFEQLADATLKSKGLAAYTTRSASDYTNELALLAREYERIRAVLPEGSPRTCKPAPTASMSSGPYPPRPERN
jgi:hypothetical protein